MQCGCAKGTSGSVDWVPSLGYWTTDCAETPCPSFVHNGIAYNTTRDYSSWPPTCGCPDALVGAVTWEFPRVDATAGSVGTPDASQPKTWVPHCTQV